jgi:hypothetical protein
MDTLHSKTSLKKVKKDELVEMFLSEKAHHRNLKMEFDELQEKNEQFNDNCWVIDHHPALKHKVVIDDDHWLEHLGEDGDLVDPEEFKKLKEEFEELQEEYDEYMSTSIHEDDDDAKDYEDLSSYVKLKQEYRDLEDLKKEEYQDLQRQIQDHRTKWLKLQEEKRVLLQCIIGNYNYNPPVEKLIREVFDPEFIKGNEEAWSALGLFHD